MSEERVFDEFSVAMDISGISPTLYCINGLSEDATCLIKKANIYEVFDFERNCKYKVKEFHNQILACIEVIHRIAIDEDTEARAIQNFFSII